MSSWHLCTFYDIETETRLPDTVTDSLNERIKGERKGTIWGHQIQWPGNQLLKKRKDQKTEKWQKLRWITTKDKSDGILRKCFVTEWVTGFSWCWSPAFHPLSSTIWNQCQLWRFSSIVINRWNSQPFRRSRISDVIVKGLTSECMKIEEHTVKLRLSAPGMKRNLKSREMDLNWSDFIYFFVKKFCLQENPACWGK